MKILHITPHMGGGVGSVLMGWMDKAIAANDHDHRILCLDYANEKAKDWACKKGFPLTDQCAFRPQAPEFEIGHSDIVLVHFWDSPMLAELFSRPLPECRLVFWLHKNTLEAMTLPVEPDWVIKTSPVQGAGKYIWSTGNMSRFFEIQPKPHRGFNVGYCGTVDYKKIHPEFLDMCGKIKKAIPEAHFTIVGDDKISGLGSGISAIDPDFTFTGKVDDVAPYLAEFDVFFYPLRSDHFGTGEQVLGESMAAGVVPVTMDNPCERLIIKHGENGFRGRTEADAIELVHCLYNNPFLRGEMSGHARQAARRIYNVDNMIDQWNGVFVDMMTDPKKQRSPL